MRIKAEEELAKMKHLKELNNALRAKLKVMQAQRKDYAELEELVRKLKEQIRNKNLTISQLQNALEHKKQELTKAIEDRKKIEQKNKSLEDKLSALYTDDYAKLKKQ
nr:hypothetical protein [uncultured bacterium]AUH21253.1 hypothetical protein [uncultured bacterium]